MIATHEEVIKVTQNGPDHSLQAMFCFHLFVGAKENLGGSEHPTDPGGVGKYVIASDKATSERVQKSLSNLSS